MSALPIPSASNVAATPEQSPTPPIPVVQYTFVDVDVSGASQQTRLAVAIHGVRVDEDIGWGELLPHSPSSSPSSDSSGHSPTYWGKYEGANAGVVPKVKAGRKKTSSRSKGKGTDDKIPRPPNAFMLFRSDFSRADKWKAVRDSIEKQQTLSKVAGLYWKGLPEEERKRYQDMQASEKLRHAALYPDYGFKPQRRSAPVKKRVNKNQELDDARAAYIADYQAKNLPVEDMAAGLERHLSEVKARLDAAKASSSASVSPAESPRALEDPPHPSGDRTPQPRPAQPAVVSLPPAPIVDPTYSYAHGAWMAAPSHAMAGPSQAPVYSAPMAALPVPDTLPLPRPDDGFSQRLQEAVNYGADTSFWAGPYSGQPQPATQQEQLFSGAAYNAPVDPYVYSQSLQQGQGAALPEWQASSLQSPAAPLPAYHPTPVFEMQQPQPWYDAQAAHQPGSLQFNLPLQQHQPPPEAQMCYACQTFHTGSCQMAAFGAAQQQQVLYAQQPYSDPSASFADGTNMGWGF